MIAQNVLPEADEKKRPWGRQIDEIRRIFGEHGSKACCLVRRADNPIQRRYGVLRRVTERQGTLRLRWSPNPLDATILTSKHDAWIAFEVGSWSRGEIKYEEMSFEAR